ncbi:MAG: sulfur carrier protein ThiS [Nitrospirota bacterium]|nr:sulfur carrier protein ThiS [Nitrospirota bacterium]
MQVEVNGLKQEMPPNSNVLQLLQQFEIAAEGIAVEINLTVIDRQAYDATVLQDGDTVEIIRFIGGGK